MRPCPSSDDGFSLPEACVAAGLVATALVALAAVFSHSIDAILAARDRTHATVLAMQKLEELLAPGDAVPAEGAEALDGRGRPVEDGSGEGLARFVREWRVQPAGGAPGARQLDVQGGRRTDGARVPVRARLVTLRRTLP